MKVNKSYMYKGFDLKQEISRQILPQKNFFFKWKKYSLNSPLRQSRAKALRLRFIGSRAQLEIIRKVSTTNTGQ